MSKVEGARFESPSKAELDQLGMPRPIVPAFLDGKEFPKLREKVEALESQQHELVAAREKELKMLDPKVLHPAELARRARDIRANYEGKLDTVTRAIGEIANNTDAARPYWTREAVLRRAVFRQNPLEDAQIRSAAILSLSKTPDNALLGIAQKAVNERSEALACVLSDELEARRDTITRDLRRQIRGTLDQLETEAERIGPTIDYLCNSPRRATAILKPSGLNRIKSGVASAAERTNETNGRS